jgi:hypothetical protein
VTGVGESSTSFGRILISTSIVDKVGRVTMLLLGPDFVRTLPGLGFRV